MSASDFAFTVRITVKNDRLTLESTHAELADILRAALNDGPDQLNWVLDCDIRPRPEPESEWTNLPPSR